MKTLRQKYTNLLLICLLIFIGTPLLAQSWTDWGNWVTISCFQGIDFRVKTKYSEYTKKYEAYIEWRNRYYEDAHFNYKITGGSYVNDHNRTMVKAGVTKSTYIGASYTSNDLDIYIDKMRFGKDGLQDYSNCDY